MWKITLNTCCSIRRFGQCGRWMKELQAWPFVRAGSNGGARTQREGGRNKVEMGGRVESLCKSIPIFYIYFLSSTVHVHLLEVPPTPAAVVQRNAKNRYTVGSAKTNQICRLKLWTDISSMDDSIFLSDKFNYVRTLPCSECTLLTSCRCAVFSVFAQRGLVMV